MKNVLAALVLGSLIIGSSTLALAANTDSGSFNVKVTVAQYTDINVPGELVLPIDGPDNKEVTGTVTIRSNFAIRLTAEASSFGDAYEDNLDELVTFSVGDKTFQPGDSKILYDSLNPGKRDYKFAAKTNFTAADEWTTIPYITSGQNVHSQITLTVEAAN